MSRPKVLLLDDGSLSRIRQTLQEFDVDLDHVRDEVSRHDLEGYDVIVASVKRLLALDASGDLGSPQRSPGAPVWIAVHGQDFLPLRLRLREQGVHFLVQSSVGSEALRLLLLGVLHRGPERRGEARLPLGSTVSCQDAAGGSFSAELLDLTREGCRLAAERAFQPGEAVQLELPASLAGGEGRRFTGRVQRACPVEGAPRWLATLAFGELDAELRERLDSILAGRVIGTVVTRLAEDPPQPAEPTPRAPVAEPVAAGSLRAVRQRRVEYERKVTALFDGGQRIVLGRDLSMSGMRAEPLPDLAVGTALELAIYGPSGAEPVLVKAVVARDDGERGTVFRFEDMSAGDRPRLKAIVRTAPEIRSLADGGADEPVVVSRVVARD